MICCLIYHWLTGGQSLEWINHERVARVIYLFMTDKHTVIHFFQKNPCDRQSILILKHKTVEDMDLYFRIYNEFAIWNRVLEFLVTLVCTKMHILLMFD